MSPGEFFSDGCCEFCICQQLLRPLMPVACLVMWACLRALDKVLHVFCRPESAGVPMPRQRGGMASDSKPGAC